MKRKANLVNCRIDKDKDAITEAISLQWNQEIELAVLVGVF